MGEAGKSLVAAGDGAAVDQQLGAVGVGVLDRVRVEVLVDVVAAVVPPAGGLGATLDEVDQLLRRAKRAGDLLGISLLK